MGQRDEQFKRSLELGRMGEVMVTGWLQSRGCGVLPCYDFSGTSGEKAPRLQFENTSLVIPDLDVCRSGARKWIEVKTYRAPAFNERRGCMVHGIPSRLRTDYLKVEIESGSEVFIAVLEVESGWLLGAALSGLEDWPCMCGGCRAGTKCTIGWRGIPAGSYWPRSSMARWHQFDDEQMSDVRAAWANKRAA